MFRGYNNNEQPFTVVQYDGSSALLVKLSGHSEIPHMAERARINVSVASTGTNKVAVSDEVLTTAKHIETLCRQLSPKDDTPAAKTSAPLAHWSKTGLSSTSFVPHHDTDSDKPPPPREYNVNIGFDIRFRDFGALGGFGSRLSALPHVEIGSISWLLTSATEKSFRSQLRKEAAQDALQKARDYCEVLDCGELRPIELVEGAQHGFSGYTVHQSRHGGLQMQSAPGMFGSASASAQAQMQMQLQQAAMSGSAAPTIVVPTDQRDETELAFEPQELKMSMEVTIKFIAR